MRLIERIVPEDAAEKGWRRTERCGKKWSRAPTDLLSLSLSLRQRRRENYALPAVQKRKRGDRKLDGRSFKKKLDGLSVYMGAHFLRKKCYLALSAFSFSFSKWALLLALSTFSFAFFFFFNWALLLADVFSFR